MAADVVEDDVVVGSVAAAGSFEADFEALGWEKGSKQNFGLGIYSRIRIPRQTECDP